MLIGWIVAAVVVVALIVTLLTRRVAHDDVHSVEGYHRSLHTLGSIKEHPVVQSDAAAGESVKPAYPESAVRLAGTPSVRVTSRPPPPVPPVPLPPDVDLDVPLAFEDNSPPPVPMISHGTGQRDKAMVSINHRPRRLAAPATAVAAVSVLIVVLLLTGSHSVAPRHTKSRADGNTSSSAPKRPPKSTTTTTATTQPPPVSGPQQSTSSSVTYDVGGNDFTLTLAATTGACWIEVSSSSSGATSFEGVLEPGEHHTVEAIGPITVIVGAPSVFGASVNGTAVALPAGFQTPFTMSFVTAGPSSG